MEMSRFESGRVALGIVFVMLAAGAALGVAGATASGSTNWYNAYNLVSDGPALAAPLADPSLVNGWGLTASPTSPWWTSNNKTSTSTLYSGVGTKSALTVSVPGGPTGTVFNGNSAAFIVSQGSKTGAARFLFATQAGTILGWSPAVNGTTAITGVDHSAQGAEYDGLATLNDRLYATDFHNARVDVFDVSFAPVTLANGFTDSQIPSGWAPFGIQALNGNIFVTYAQQDSVKRNDVPGGGRGYVDEYSPDGVLLARVAKRGLAKAPLNSPWGLAMAPANFGGFGGDLLVGNFGNGKISAYQPPVAGGTKWTYKGQLRVATGTIIKIEGLWAIAFGNGAAAGPTNYLYFISGPNGQTHGLFGLITVG
jgi:uncharacterized protein (TIGR03118 family)